MFFIINLEETHTSPSYMVHIKYTVKTKLSETQLAKCRDFRAYLFVTGQLVQLKSTLYKTKIFFTWLLLL
jgi:hypothetical protein